MYKNFILVFLMSNIDFFLTILSILVTSYAFIVTLFDEKINSSKISKWVISIVLVIVIALSITKCFIVNKNDKFLYYSSIGTSKLISYSWQHKIDSPPIFSSVFENLLFFGTEDNLLYKYNFSNNKIEWHFTCNSPIKNRPLFYSIGNKNFMLLITNTKVYRLNIDQDPNKDSDKDQQVINNIDITDCTGEYFIINTILYYFDKEVGNIKLKRFDLKIDQSFGECGLEGTSLSNNIIIDGDFIFVGVNTYTVLNNQGILYKIHKDKDFKEKNNTILCYKDDNIYSIIRINNNVVFTTLTKKIVCLNKVTLKKQWNNDLFNDPEKVIVHNDFLIDSFKEKPLIFYDYIGQQGFFTEKKEAIVDDYIFDKNLYFSTNQELKCLKFSSSLLYDKQWTIQNQSFINKIVHIDNNFILLYCSDKKLYLIDIHSFP